MILQSRRPSRMSVGARGIGGIAAGVEGPDLCCGGVRATSILCVCSAGAVGAFARAAKASSNTAPSAYKHAMSP